jgi:hypothetical protein
LCARKHVNILPLASLEGALDLSECGEDTHISRNEFGIVEEP